MLATPLEIAVQVFGQGGNAACACAAEDAAAQNQANGFAAGNVAVHAVEHGVKLVGQAVCAGLIKRAQQIGKKQHAQIGMTAEAFAVFQLHFRGRKKRARQQPVILMPLRHLGNGGSAAA